MTKNPPIQNSKVLNIKLISAGSATAVSWPSAKAKFVDTNEANTKKTNLSIFAPLLIKRVKVPKKF
tara:strand:- start:744 stop:941 length:198 start_codon:yes stop_codon:yes gene_type:complete